MPLTLCKENSIVKVIKIIGSEESKKRIQELGFVPDSELKIIINNYGELLVEIKGTRIAICKNIASKILIN